MLSLWNKKGYNFVTTMVAVVIIIILITTALGIFSRSRIRANEVAAYSQLINLASCFETYRAMNGRYPGSSGNTFTADLKTMNPPCTEKELLPDSPPGIKRGYQFDVSYSDAVTAHAFILYTKPTQYKRSGIRSYVVKQDLRTWVTDDLIEGDSGDPENPDIPPPPPPPGGSCPYVYVWDGKDYVKDNDILPGGNPSEYTDYYLLTQRPVEKDGKFYLKIVEELPEVSYLDKISLISVEHNKGAKIAPSPEGKIFTYNKLIKPKQATDKENHDILARVDSQGNGDYHGNTGDYIILNFGKLKPNQNGLRLILSTDLEYAYGSVIYKVHSLYIYVWDNSSTWQLVSIVSPHEKWDIWAIDLTELVPKTGKELKVKLAWSTEHKLDYCLLDTSKQEPLAIKHLALLNAQGAKKDNVLAQLLNSDNKYAVMKKGDQISLEFAYEPQTNLARDFIFVSEGYYNTDQGKRINWRRAF